MKIQPVVALDIGSTKVACAIGLPTTSPHGLAMEAPGCSGGFELLGTSVVAYPAPMEAWVGDPLVVSRAIEQALEAAAVDVSAHEAVVAIDPPSVKSERVSVSVPLADEPISVKARDLERLQAAALHQALSIDREPLLVERLGCSGNGFEGVRDPRGLPASRLHGTFLLISIPIAARRAVVQAVESAGLEAAHLAYALPCAVASMTDEALYRKRALLLDLGGSATHVGLFAEGALQAVEVVPWGGWTLATAIARTLQVTMDQAVAWSLEGIACRKFEVRAMIEQQWADLQPAIDAVLKDQPGPDLALISGRGALMDGFLEWVERTTGLSSALCRASRTTQGDELSHQVGLSTACGLLATVTQAPRGPLTRSPQLFNRLIDRTRAILTEYF